MKAYDLRICSISYQMSHMHGTKTTSATETIHAICFQCDEIAQIESYCLINSKTKLNKIARPFFHDSQKHSDFH